MKEDLLKLIDAEDKKNPLTDRQLADRLKVQRTRVTALRGEMGLGDSRERKKPFILKALGDVLAEDPGLSDRKITRVLKDQGFRVSRFLVGQYRKELEDDPLALPRLKEVEAPGPYLPEEVSQVRAFESIIGYDGSIKAQIEQAKAAVLYPPHGLHTLILGPTGSGKSNLAEAMYNFALQIGQLPEHAPFVVFSCADYADNPQLLLSQLFGHGKGAFTGAQEAKRGLIEKADGGILFLDEIHRLPPEGQEILYYIIDKGKFRRLGETENLRSVKVMIIAATSEDIKSSLLLTFRRRIPMNIELSPIVERPISERYTIIREFFSKEAARTKVRIKVSQKALRALLLYDCPGNIGQLRSDIQVACARGFLAYVGSKGDLMEIGLADLPTHVRRGLLGKEDLVPEVEAILDHDFDTRPGELVGKTLLKEDLYTLPAEIYDYIEEEYMELEAKGLRPQDINRTIGAELEIKFQQLIKQVQISKRSVTKEELAEIVGKKVVAMAEKVTQVAEKKLGPVDDHLFYCIAVHLGATLDRIYRGKTIVNPHLENVMKDYKLEYGVAQEIADEIEGFLGYRFPQDEVGFIAMYLRAVSHPSRKKKGKVGVVVLTHGPVAQGMAEVANRLLGVNHAHALEMSLEEKPESALERAVELVKRVDEGKGVLLLADMGSLLTFGPTITQRTGISTETMAKVDTTMVLDAVRWALMPDTPLDEIIAVLKEDAAPAPKTCQKEKAVITLCLTGEGTALRLKKLLEKMVPDMGKRAKIIPVGIIGDEEIGAVIERIGAHHDVVAIVGTMAPGETTIPFITVEEIIQGRATQKLRRILDLETGGGTFVHQWQGDFPLAEMFFDDLILAKAKTGSKQELIDALGQLLLRGGYCQEGFLLDVYRREVMGPTGIGQGIAIPHGTPVNVKRAAIAVATLDEPIKWWEGQEVDIVFMLALKEESQGAFQKFYSLLKDKDLLIKLRSLRSPADLRRCLLEKAITYD